MQARHEICAVEMMEVRHINKRCLVMNGEQEPGPKYFVSHRKDGTKWDSEHASGSSH